MTGEFLKIVLEDVADNLFNSDPYYQQGGDMVRVGGLQYRIDPMAAAGQRISDMRLQGAPVEAAKTYKVAGWASMQPTDSEPIWDVVGRWLQQQQRISSVAINEPTVVGLDDNLGMVR